MERLARRKFKNMSGEEQHKIRRHAKNMAHQSMKTDTSNRMFANSQEFKDLCAVASTKIGKEVKPTVRQAARYRNNHGSVYAALA